MNRADNFYDQVDVSFTEKQISVDPTSLLRESLTKVGSPLVQLQPVVTNQKMNGMYPPLPLVSPKSKFISVSTPNSASSSPRFNPSLLKKAQRNPCPASPRNINNSPDLHHSPVYSLLASRQNSYLQRSKSCGEGRASAPSDEFDICLSKLNRLKHGSFNKKVEAEKDEKKADHSNSRPDEEFKCGAMCLFLPGFGKGKPVRPTKKEGTEVPTMISRRVSLEKFECGSWTSSAIVNDNGEDGDSVNLYFDLPLELIRTSVSDAHVPVTTAFLFDKDHKGALLKNGSARGAAKSRDSGRHVRFSTSSPQAYPASPTSCVTPRLRKAREEFNAFLEAQSAS